MGLLRRRAEPRSKQHAGRWLTWGYGDPFRIRAPASARSPEPNEHSDVPVHGSLTQLRVLVGRTSPRNWNKARDGAGD